MNFRNGGRLRRHDKLKLDGAEIKLLNVFPYLGIHLTVTGKSFSKHSEERSRKAMVATTAIKALSRLSLNTNTEAL